MTPRSGPTLKVSRIVHGHILENQTSIWACLSEPGSRRDPGGYQLHQGRMALLHCPARGWTHSSEYPSSIAKRVSEKTRTHGGCRKVIEVLPDKRVRQCRYSSVIEWGGVESFRIPQK